MALLEAPPPVAMFHCFEAFGYAVLSVTVFLRARLLDRRTGLPVP